MIPDLEALDLIPAHLGLSIGGAVLSMLAMQFYSSQHLDPHDSALTRWSKRAALAIVAASLLWSSLYAMERSWQPWPPFLLLCLGVDLFLLVLVVWRHKRSD